MTRPVRILAAVVLVAAALLWAAGLARAMEPPRPGELARYRLDGSLASRVARAHKLGDDKFAPGLLQHALLKLQRTAMGTDLPLRLPPAAWRGMPTTGTVNVLTVPICFSDYPPSTSQDALTSSLFGAGDPANAPYESVASYYRRSSYGKLAIQGDVLPWYDTGRPRSAVAKTDRAREALIEQALQSYATAHPSYDFSRFDNDHDGTIDYVVVIWTGPDNGWSGFWWGYQTSFQDAGFRIGLPGKQVTLGTYSWQWEYRYEGSPPAGRTFDPIVTIHETGHALGLPDYYDYQPGQGPDGGVGGLDMMDDNWGDHNCFSKFLLDWITPRVVGGGSTALSLRDSGEYPDATVVMPGASASPFREYFMVQNRYRAGNDGGPQYPIPADGLLIWHVDARLTRSDPNAPGADFRYDNSYTGHKLLKLMEADGKETITKGGWAGASDFYRAGKVFGTATHPNSARYGGAYTGVLISGISTSGPLMSANAAIIARDVTPPRTVASGGAGWYKAPVTISLAASDHGSGVLTTQYRIDAGAWTTGTAAGVAAPADHSRDGRHVVSYRSTDLAGNVEQIRTVTVWIDTRPPVCAAPAPAVASSGHLASLTYRVNDALSPTVTVTIKVSDGSGVVKTLTHAAVPTGKTLVRQFTCSLTPGAYRFTVSARDLAGNVRTGSSQRLTVR